MSVMGRIARATGVYEQFQAKFFEETLIPFATRSQVNLIEARFLAELTREAQEGPIIEVGTLFGSSTKIILLNKAPGQKVIAVDLFSWNPAGLTPDQHYTIASSALRAFSDDSDLDIIRADKNDFYKTYSGPPPALVFLDADHSYAETHKDIEWARSSRAKIICGHDYTPDFPGVMQAVNEAGGASMICGTLWRLSV